MATKKAAMPNLPVQAEIEKQLIPYINYEVQPVPITNDDEYIVIGTELTHLKREQQTVTRMKADALRPITELRDTITGWFKPALERLAQRESAIKRALLDYDRAKEAERKRAEAQLRDQHAKEVAAALAKADALSSAGKEEEAEAVIDEMPSMPVVISAKPKLAGISTRMQWKAEVKDFPLFMVWCIDNNRLDLLEPNDQALQAFARLTKGSVPVEGVIIREEVILAARGA